MDCESGRGALISWLRGACLEIIPLKGVDKHFGEIPDGCRVAITCSPTKGIQATIDLAGRMVKPGGYSPDELLLGLASRLGGSTLDIQGIHLYSFNQIRRTEEWRTKMLASVSQ